MNQATIHTDPTAGGTLARPRIARIAALVLLAVLAALTVQSFFSKAGAQTPAHVAPAVVQPSDSSLCREYPKARFVFIDARAVPTVASTCANQTMLSV
jgi:hypothetical protein